jgi:hypothetical protein
VAKVEICRDLEGERSGCPQAASRMKGDFDVVGKSGVQKQCG